MCWANAMQVPMSDTYAPWTQDSFGKAMLHSWLLFTWAIIHMNETQMRIKLVSKMLVLIVRPKGLI